MAEQIFNENMSNEEIFLAYRLATEKGLFESADFFLQDDDYLFLLKKVIIDYGIDGNNVLNDKYKRRLWGIYIRELVYRYASSYNEIWRSLQTGLESDIEDIIKKQPNEVSEIINGKERFNRENSSQNQKNIQTFCYNSYNGNGGDALKKTFGTATFENPEYWIPSANQNSDRRYLRFLLKLAILPSDYFPERGDNSIYKRLRDAYIECNPTYFSNNPASSYKNRIKDILTKDGWNVHPNTVGAFAKRLEEFFSYVFSWKKCGYTNDQAYEALKGTFPFLNICKENNYLFDFLKKEYNQGTSTENVGNKTKYSQNQIKRHFQFSYVLDRRANQFYFRRPEGNLKYHLSTYLSNKDLIDSNAIIQINDKENNETLATININGFIQFPNCQSGDKRAYNRAVLKLAREESINIAWNDSCITEKNPWYKLDGRYLLNQFGTYADSWNIGKEAYLVYPEGFGKLVFDQDWMQQDGQVEYLDFISSNSGMNIYKFSSTSQLEVNKIRLSTSNGKKIEIELRDLEQIRTIKNFEGSPTFAEQNLHSKIAIGQIQFSLDDFQDVPEQDNGNITYTISDNVLTLRNKTSDIVILDEKSKEIQHLFNANKELKKFPYIVLLPENSMIWISNEDNVKMCHWCVADGAKEGRFSMDEHDCIEITNESIQPASSFDGPNKFHLIYPTWNGRLGQDNCISSELGINTVWLEPEFPEANVYLNWRENDITFSVSVSPDERLSNQCFKSLAEIYRAFKINGAQLTTGWDYKGNKFIKTFIKSDNYETPERNPIYRSEELYDSAVRGAYLKNYLINKQSIEEKCKKINQGLHQSSINYTFNPEQFDSVARLISFIKKDRPAIHHFLTLSSTDVQNYIQMRLCEGGELVCKCVDNGLLNWEGSADVHITYPKSWGKIQRANSIRYSLEDDELFYVYNIKALNEYPPDGRISITTANNHTINICIKVQQLKRKQEKKLPGDFSCVSVGEVSYTILNKSNVDITKSNDSNSIVEYPAKIELTEFGFVDFPRIILLPQNVKMCIMRHGNASFAFISGRINNLSSKWNYDNEHDVYSTRIENDNVIPLTDEIYLKDGLIGDSNGVVRFYDTSYLVKPNFIWFKYGNNKEFQTGKPEILNKGLDIILYHLPINEKKFEFIYKEKEFFHYNEYEENYSCHYGNNQNLEENISGFHSGPNAAEWHEWQNRLGLKSVNVQLECIKHRPNDLRGFLAILSSENMLDPSEAYPINKSPIRFGHGTIGIPDFYEELEASNARTPEENKKLEQYRSLQNKDFAPKPKDGGVSFFCIYDEKNESNSATVKLFLSFWPEIKKKKVWNKILKEYDIPNEHFFQEPYLFHHEYIELDEYEMYQTIAQITWNQLLIENGVNERTTHKDDFQFEQDYINYNREQMRVKIKNIIQTIEKIEKSKAKPIQWKIFLLEEGIPEKDIEQNEIYAFNRYSFLNEKALKEKAKKLGREYRAAHP